MRWLSGCSEAAVGEALRAVAPELSRYPLAVGDPGPEDSDPVFWSGTADLGGRFVAKFAWSEPAAVRLAREISALEALRPVVPYLPEVVVGSTEPVLLVTRRVPGRSLFEVVDGIDRERAGEQLARFLAALHGPAARERAGAVLGDLSGPRLPPAATTTLREGLGRWIRPEQRATVRRWCDRVDAALAGPAATVLVHGDFHGNNQVWDGGELRLVVDLELVGTAEPEYELRALPGPAMGPGVELLAAVTRHYERLSGRRLSTGRLLAWHVRQTLGDVLWRAEAGLPMADGGTPPQWVDDLAGRLAALGIAP
jgi:aminoglycoside phosphotransferase (APT) family kinase protein